MGKNPGNVKEKGFVKQIKEVRSLQASIDTLLSIGHFNTKSIEWKLTPLHQDSACCIGFVDIETADAGRCPDHIHEGCIEYLIVLRGKVLFNLDGVDLRILKAGDIASVPPNVKHHSKPLEDQTRLLYVTVPADPGMEELHRRFSAKE